MALDGKVVVITGGARGYGSALVQGFLDAGARIVAIDQSWPEDDLTQKLRAQKDTLLLSADVTDDQQVGEAFRLTMQTYGDVDVVINNAAMLQRHVFPSGMHPVLDSDFAIWERMLAVNVLGPLRITRHFIKPMLEKRRGSLVMVSSGSGNRGRAGDQPYGASKAALTNWSSSLAEETKAHNITVNVILPPAARTTNYEEQTRARKEQGIAVDRLPARPEAIVPLALHLAQQDAGSATGQVIGVTEWNANNGFGGAEAWASPTP